LAAALGRVLSFSPVAGIGTPPTPHRRRVYPLPFGSGRRGTLAGERGVGRLPILTRGHTLAVLFVYTYFVGDGIPFYCEYNVMLANRNFLTEKLIIQKELCDTYYIHIHVHSAYNF